MYISLFWGGFALGVISELVFWIIIATYIKQKKDGENFGNNS